MEKVLEEGTPLQGEGGAEKPGQPYPVCLAYSSWGALFNWGHPILSQPCLGVYHTDKNSPNSFVVPPAIPLPLEEIGDLQVPQEGVEPRLEP